MSNEPAKVLITGDIEKLPISFRMLLDPNAPLPSGVQFFQLRQTLASITRTVVFGAGLVAAGILLCFLGLVLVFLPIVGLVFIVGGAMLLNSVRPKMSGMRQQHAGNVVRNGVFILPDYLMIRTDIDYTLIPRERAGVLTGKELVYFWNDQTKSLTLPSDLVDATDESMHAALQAWLHPTAA